MHAYVRATILAFEYNRFFLYAIFVAKGIYNIKELTHNEMINSYVECYQENVFAYIL